MLRFLADENFNGDIVRGLLRQKPDLDIVRLQDIGLSGASDERVLEWAADEGRVLQTHDVNTITRYAYSRIKAGKPVAGVFEVSSDISVGQAIEELLFVAECSLENEWRDQIRYLPIQ